MKEIPVILLGIDKSSESKMALELLQISGLKFRAETSYEGYEPWVEYGDIKFKFMEGVYRLINGIDPEIITRYLQNRGSL